VTKPTLPFAEFIILIAILFSLIAFGTDAMLPAFPEIAEDLQLGDVNQAQLVLSSFVLGTGVGQLLTGPISDAFGRKPIITAGILVFIAACVMAYMVKSLEMMLLARFIQGLGISAPRTVTMAMVRDLFAGRMMARVMSIAMAIFVVVPAVAPYVGQLLFLNYGWRSIYIAFILFSLIGLVWLNVRQPETLVPEKRRPFRAAKFLSAFQQVIANRSVVTYTAVLSLGFGGLFSYLTSAQQVFVDTFDKGTAFPAYFAMIALISGAAGFLNAALVVRLGMRTLATFAFGLQLSAASLMAAILFFQLVPDALIFPVFVSWSIIVFFMAGLTFGNLNALAMEPMGHIAGMASAIIGASATVLAMLIAVPVGLAFNGSALPLTLGVAISAAVAFALMLSNPKDAQEQVAPRTDAPD